VAARSPIRNLARALVPNVSALPRDQRDAVTALAAHLVSRFEQDTFEPLCSVGCTFLTVGYVQRRLREVGARCTGEKGAAKALRWLCECGILERTPAKSRNHGAVEKAAPEKFGRAEDAAGGEGGRDSQPSLHRSYWWRVYRVVPLSKVLGAYEKIQGAYGRFLEVPKHLASLSAWAKRQGLISRQRRPSEFSKGSVQEAFAVHGPP